MSDDAKEPENKPVLPSSASAEPSVIASTWQLPSGIEDHLESGLIKAVAGVTVGGLVGLAMFRTGKGWRTAATTAGLGVAIGSTYERSVAPRFNTSE